MSNTLLRQPVDHLTGGDAFCRASA